MWRIMKSKSWRRGDSNFILQSYCAFFFHFSLSFCWVFLAYSDLHHPALKKLPKLPHTKKKAFRVSAWYPFTGRNSRILPVRLVRGRYGRYFFSTKQGGYLYQFTGRYNIYQPYWPVQYGINFLIQVTPDVTLKNVTPPLQ